MSKKEPRLIGLVQTIPFNPIGGRAQKKEHTTMVSMLEEYGRLCPHSLPVAGFSNPVRPTLFETMTICERIVDLLAKEIFTKPSMVNMAFVLMDGTPWQDVPEKTDWGKDPIHASCFWNNGKLVVAVLIGVRRFFRTSMKYHKESPFHRHSVVFQIDPTVTTSLWKDVMRDTLVTDAGQQLAIYGPLVQEFLGFFVHPDHEYPIAAATHYDDKIWFVSRPHRHHHIVCSEEFHEVKKRIGKEPNYLHGFLTNHGNLVSRYRAMYLSARSYQITNVLHEEVKYPFILSRGHYDQRRFNEVESMLSGIRREEDMGSCGYVIAQPPLFSEDLW